ncbi:MAG: GNAT family N-acetyltransferase [Solirubrobacteraceae bacterium]
MAFQQGTVTIRELGHPGDLGWVVMANGELYVQEFGWDTSFETLCVRIVADYAAQAGAPGTAAWIAELDGARVGCVLVVAGDEPGLARLRLLLVDERARGRRLGYRLVAIALQFGAAAGYERMQLWTNHPLAAARHVYLEHGFSLVREEPHHSFGVDLVGQTYELDLCAGVSDGDGPGRAQPIDTR